MFQLLKNHFFRNPFDVALAKAADEGKKKFLVIWNRGLGDIPLGLYALTQRMRSFIPDAAITFLTRPDLREGFALLGNVETLVSPNIRRWQEFALEDVLKQLGHQLSDFDQVFEKPDPTRWLKWQLGTLTPKLSWQSEWDGLCERFALKAGVPIIGVHVQTETFYNYEKNWTEEKWRALFHHAASEMGAQILLFGFKPTPAFEGEGIIDLRGRTSLIEMMSIIKNHCTHLVVPDSGVLSITYYLDIQCPLKVVSLWADPEQGVLRQKVASPNAGLKHYPLIGRKKDIGRIPVEAVMECLKNEHLTCQSKSF
jgi:ADP-heptose:LPS heptosyltransferase